MLVSFRYARRKPQFIEGNSANPHLRPATSAISISTAFPPPAVLSTGHGHTDKFTLYLPSNYTQSTSGAKDFIFSIETHVLH